MGSDEAFGAGVGGAGALPQTFALDVAFGVPRQAMNAACCAAPIATHAINVPAGTATSGRYEFALSDADVERIARRVVELLAK